ncbi:MAG: hypothetical protein ACP5XB_16340 [Isosphaeraceae bacterium]
MLRSQRTWLAVAFLALAIPLGMAPADSPVIDEVQEDWQLVVANPDPSSSGPQITTCMSPNSNPTASFVTFYVNYQDYPDWQPGGMQVKSYGPLPSGSSIPPVLDANNSGTGVCETQGETITWTQQMTLSGGSVNFNVLNGQSVTWGKFGQGLGLLGVSFPCTLSDLSGYQPTYSVAKSGVSWESNRVTSMTLVQVRYYSGGQLISTDTTARSVNLGTAN